MFTSTTGEYLYLSSLQNSDLGHPRQVFCSAPEAVLDFSVRQAMSYTKQLSTSALQDTRVSVRIFSPKNRLLATIRGSVLTFVAVMLPILDRWGDGKVRPGKTEPAHLFPNVRVFFSSFSLLSKNKCVRFAHHFQWALAPMADFTPPPAQSEILLPLGGKRALSPEPPFAPLWEFCQFPKGVQSKKKGQPSPRPSATHSAVFSKLVPDSRGLRQRKKRPLRAPDGLYGSGYRAYMI